MKRLVLLAFLLIFIPLNTAFAKDDVATPSSQVIQETVNYELPYPGILPDNPLYTIKVVRDRIVLFLISDNLKKAEFDILSSDKRLNAGIYLIDKKKDALASSVIAKSNNYFHEGITSLIEAKKAGKDTSALFGKMESSLKKHTLVLKELEKKIDVRYKEEIKYEEKRLLDLSKYLSG